MRQPPTMYVCLTCGSCDSHLELNVIHGEEGPAWMMVHRFANAHAEHQYVTPLQEMNQHQ